MRPILLLGAILLASPVWAGLYNPDEPYVGPPPFYLQSEEGQRGFLYDLIRYRSISMPKVEFESPDRFRYLLIADSLYPGNRATLKAEQKLAISEYLIRRNRLIEARELLTPEARKAGEIFFLQSNLGTACQLLAEAKVGADRVQDYQQAEDYLTEGLRLWPDSWIKLTDSQRDFLKGMHWNEEPFERCRLAEEYHRKLVRLRRIEAQRKLPADRVDALFTNDKGEPLRFIGPSGEYTPGKLADSEIAKLPNKKVSDALLIVQQLVLWLPNDARLVWLLGELYNASGESWAAWKLFEDLVYDRNERIDELMKHRAILANAPLSKASQKKSNLDFAADDPTDRVKKVTDKDDSPPLDVKSLLIALGAGIIVGMMTLWQVREIRRRRQPRM